MSRLSDKIRCPACNKQLSVAKWNTVDRQNCFIQCGACAYIYRIIDGVPRRNTYADIERIRTHPENLEFKRDHDKTVADMGLWG